MTPQEAGHRGGKAKARNDALRRNGIDPEIITEHGDAKSNEDNTVKNIRIYMERKVHSFSASVMVLLCATAASATIAPGKPDVLIWNPSTATGVTYSVFYSVTNNVWLTSTTAGSKTNFVLSGIDFGTWWLCVKTVSSNGVYSVPSIPVRWTNDPDPPIGLRIESSTNSTAIIWVHVLNGSALVECSASPAGPWNSLLQIVNTTVKELGLRISVDDPRKFFRTTSSPALLLRRQPPIPYSPPTRGHRKPPIP